MNKKLLYDYNLYYWCENGVKGGSNGGRKDGENSETSFKTEESLWKGLVVKM